MYYKILFGEIQKKLDTCHVALSGEWSPLISKVIEIVHSRSYHNWTEDSHVYAESDSLVWKKLIINLLSWFFWDPMAYQSTWSYSFNNEMSRGVQRGGHSWGGALWTIHQLAFPFLRQSTFYIALHCIAFTQIKRLRKEIRYVLIHNSTLQSFVWSSIALNIHVWKLNIFIGGFTTKVTYAFLASETLEKWRFQRYIGHATL